jgi:hypothetical protein
MTIEIVELHEFTHWKWWIFPVRFVNVYQAGYHQIPDWAVWKPWQLELPAGENQRAPVGWKGAIFLGGWGRATYTKWPLDEPLFLDELLYDVFFLPVYISIYHPQISNGRRFQLVKHPDTSGYFYHLLNLINLDCIWILVLTTPEVSSWLVILCIYQLYIYFLTLPLNQGCG